MLTRRQMLLMSASAAAVLGTAALWRQAGGTGNPAHAASEAFEIAKTEAEWRELLAEAEYYVLRAHGTERPFTSPLLQEKRTGVYKCKGCGLPAYASEAKYDSGTGWPSFYESLPGAIGTRADYSLILPRTEVHCRRCGGHFGHIFDDGPPPTGKRHCLNGIALAFEPATT